MLYTTVLLLALCLAEGPDVVELRAVAEGKAKDRAYVDAGELYVKLAALPGVERRREMLNAHTNFEAAYLTSHAPRHLCRALDIAERVVHENGFEDEQMGQFWRELVADDLDRLREDAIKTRRTNCRFVATGRPRTSVPLIADGDLPTRLTMPVETGISEKDKGPPISRRYRAKTATGAAFTGMGLSFLGLFVGALAVEIDQVQAIRRRSALVGAQGRVPTADEQAWIGARQETAILAQTVAIGVGAAGVVSLATGVALLATRKRHAKPLTLQPYGGAQGAGFLLQGRF